MCFFVLARRNKSEISRIWVAPFGKVKAFYVVLKITLDEKRSWKRRPDFKRYSHHCSGLTSNTNRKYSYALHEGIRSIHYYCFCKLIYSSHCMEASLLHNSFFNRTSAEMKTKICFWKPWRFPIAILSASKVCIDWRILLLQYTC